MLAKRSAEGKQAAHRYRAGAFKSAFRDEEKALNNPETPASIQSVQRK